MLLHLLCFKNAQLHKQLISHALYGIPEECRKLTIGYHSSSVFANEDTDNVLRIEKLKHRTYALFISGIRVCHKVNNEVNDCYKKDNISNSWNIRRIKDKEIYIIKSKNVLPAMEDFCLTFKGCSPGKVLLEKCDESYLYQKFFLLPVEIHKDYLNSISGILDQADDDSKFDSSSEDTLLDHKHSAKFRKGLKISSHLPEANLDVKNPKERLLEYMKGVYPDQESFNNPEFVLNEFLQPGSSYYRTDFDSLE